VRHASRRRALVLIAGGSIASSLAACGLPERGIAVPAGRATEATVLGLANERFFPAHGSAALEAEVGLAMDRQARALGRKSHPDLPAWQLLAISGGGENGAFGAGLLCGWTQQGSRPEFELVTGISTGALSAPFAFLGPSYDSQLRSVYTEITPERVLRKRSLAAALFDDAMADNAPLFSLISQYFDAAMLAAIARAYQSGRLLLVATTDLDAQQPVIWNIGAIAASGHPRALDTVRRVLLASSAIPAALPPVMIDVTLDGETRQEMHVDGGAFVQTFLYPVALTEARRQKLASGGRVLRAEAFVIRNGRLDPEWAAVERRTLGIAGRAIATMITSAGFNDVVRIYDTTRRDDIGYNLAYIGRDFAVPLPTPFDPAYMRALFDYGYQKALRGYDWAKRPPVV
jgi:predicted acylesterase/phospholipase RssA